MADSGTTIDTVPLGCWAASYQRLRTAACPTVLQDRITILAGTSILLNTGTGVSPQHGVTCVPFTTVGMPTSTAACVLAASTLVIEHDATLLATGPLPLVLLGHTIDIQGTIDVASHVGGQLGPAANTGGCNSNGRLAMGNGGGQGGTYIEPGSNGGNGDTAGDLGGQANSTVGLDKVAGGCPGGPNSASSPAVSGQGGGAAWISVDPGGTLTLGDAAVIDASGASGAGGVAVDGHSGGGGGGSGGLIILQAPTIKLSATASIFANGGGGGGGGGGTAGDAGIDSNGPASAAAGGGAGGPASPGDTPGVGGFGFPATERDGIKGTGTASGGGGGGGGAGTIWVATDSAINDGNISPKPLKMSY